MDVFARFYDLDYASRDFWAFRAFYFSFQVPYLHFYTPDITERIMRVDKNINLLVANPDTGDVNAEYFNIRLRLFEEVGARFEELERDIQNRQATCGQDIPNSDFPIGKRGEFEATYYDDLDQCLPGVTFTKEAVQQLTERIKKRFPGPFFRYQQALEGIVRRPMEPTDRPAVPTVRRIANVPAPVRVMERGEAFIILKHMPEKTISTLYNSLLANGMICECGIDIFRAAFTGSQISNKINWRFNQNQLRYLITALVNAGYISEENRHRATVFNFTIKDEELDGDYFRGNEGIAKKGRDPINKVLNNCAVPIPPSPPLR
jgi:hypothetical protein